MKKTFPILLALISVLNVSATYGQITLTNLLSYIKYPYDKLDETLTQKGYKFDGSNKTNDSAENYMWIKKNEIVSLKFTPDTISLIDPKLGRTGYVNVIKNGMVYFQNNEGVYNSILREVRTKGFRRTKSEIFNNTIQTTYESNNYYILFSKVKMAENIMYGIVIEGKAYTLGEAHIE